MKTGNRVIAILSLILGIYVVVEGKALQIFAANGNPGPGFMPFIIGLLITFVGALILATTFSAKTDTRSLTINWADIRDMSIIGGSSLVAIVLTPFLGIVVSLGLMSGALAALMGERRIYILLGLVIILPAFLYLLFGVGLGVPLPMGILKG